MAKNKKPEAPIDRIEWVDRETLTANNYNPNQQASQESNLLEVSILEDGWTQPIVINEDNEIVDGFHRWKISGRKAVKAIYGNLVPIARLAPTSLNDRMLSTIRHNRARGTHHVEGMANIVQILIEAGKSFEEIQHRLGMDYEEVERFAIKVGIPKTALIVDHEYSQAWVPSK